MRKKGREETVRKNIDGLKTDVTRPNEPDRQGDIGIWEDEKESI